jgi:hypothetical protein
VLLSSERPTLDKAHPNLLKAVSRLRRVMLAWGALFALLALWSLAQTGLSHPALPLAWLAAALLLILSAQPALLALVAILWGFSLLPLLPAVEALLGPDPLIATFAGGTAERLAAAVLRVIFLLMAWNQFLFYRMLYGTESMHGVDANLPAIPQMVANRSDALAGWARLLGALALVLLWPGALLGASRASLWLLHVGLSLGLMGVGLGTGAAFSPTSRRPSALTGAGLGLIALLAGLWLGRALTG